MSTLDDQATREAAINAIDRLADVELLGVLKSLAEQERHATAHLIAALAEMERRQLYLGQGCSSLFAYCTDVLGLSPDAAYNRVQAARVGVRFPAVLRDLESGALTVSTVRLLAPMLTPENHLDLLEAARHRPKREVERLVASIGPEGSVRPESTMTPVGGGCFLFRFAAPQATCDKFEEARRLLRHQVPDGDFAAVFDRALTSLLKEVKRTKMGAVRRPRGSRPTVGGSRSIPADVRRAVWTRDEGQCAFVGAGGQRCQERAFLEFHHLVPFADGGQATVENIQLRCRAHNTYEAKQWDAGSVVEDSSSRNGEPTSTSVVRSRGG